MKSQNTLFGSGDNTYNFIWNEKYSTCPTFAKCTELPLEGDEYVTQISAFNDSVGLLLSSSKVLYKHEKDSAVTYDGSYRMVKCSNDELFGLNSDGRIVNITTNDVLDSNSYDQLCVSSNYVVGIDQEKNAVLVDDIRSSENEKKVIAHNAVAIGCNDDVIFVSDEEKLMKYADGNLEVLMESKFIQIECNEENALFLDDSGVVWKYDLGSVIRIYSLPVIVQVAVGVQHFAVLSYDGRAYTWGFNPSGQLGIGCDLSTNEPTMVKDGVIQIGCSTNNTFLLCSENKLPIYPKEMKSKSLLNLRDFKKEKVRNISRSELLF